ncbi:DUF3667 domain-containing protein [Nonlabens spongiae]|nr:DUF3667 domain-containing protein [Nonlabens spongiae]
MKNVAHDFSDMYLGLDTKFVHTFFDLFRKPEMVINGYIHGRRTYYMDAIRYTLLAIFVSGINVFVMKNSGALDSLMNDLYSGEIYREIYSEKQLEFQKSFQSKFMDYQGFFILLTIPLLALAARITFWGKKYYNYTEQVVFYLYTYAHMTIATTPITIFLLYVNVELFLWWSTLVFPAQLLFNALCYKRCFNLSLGATVLKTLVGLMVFTILLVLIALITLLVIALVTIIAIKYFNVDPEVVKQSFGAG